MRRHRIAGSGTKVHERPQVDMVRVHAFTVEGGVRGQRDHFLCNEALGLRLQFAPTGIQISFEASGPITTPLPPSPSIGLVTRSAMLSST